MPEVLEAPATTPSTPATAVIVPPPSEPGLWRSTLPEEFRSSAALAKFNDIPALAKGYIEADKALLTPRLAVPQSNWTEKEYGELYGKLGRPDKADGYNFKPLENLPEGMTASPEQDKWFGEQAHKLGLSTAQASALREQFVNFQAQRALGTMEQTRLESAKRDTEIAKIKSEHGAKWDAVWDAANRVFGEYGGKEVQDALAEKGMRDHPALIRMMVKIGQTLSDHSVITGVPRISGAFNASPAQAQAELDKMSADPEMRKILTTASHPQHDALVKRRAELMRSMVPVTE